MPKITGPIIDATTEETVHAPTRCCRGEPEEDRASGARFSARLLVEYPPLHASPGRPRRYGHRRCPLARCPRRRRQRRRKLLYRTGPCIIGGRPRAGVALWGRFSLVPYKVSASLVRVVAPTVSGFAGDFRRLCFRRPVSGRPVQRLGVRANHLLYWSLAARLSTLPLAHRLGVRPRRVLHPGGVDGVLGTQRSCFHTADRARAA